MFVRSERVKQAALEAGKETWEESQDFGEENDPDDPISGFEFSELQEEELREAQAELMAEIQRRKNPAPASQPGGGPDTLSPTK